MKSAIEHTESLHTNHTPSGDQPHGRSGRIHYILVAVLLAVVFLLSTWVASAPNTFSPPQAWSGFALFWLTGGIVTLLLLTLAARR